MNRIDFDAINAALSAETLVPQWLPDGKRIGSEWIARNPTRADNRPGSFSINMKSGAWADFASGDDGGDLVSLFAYLFHGNDNGRAAKELAETFGVRIDDTTREQAKRKVEDIRDSQPTVVMPAPNDAGQPDFAHFKHGRPSTVWPYYDTTGALLMFVCRFDHADGGKDILPLSWCDHPGKPSRWTWRGVTGTAKRPLYGQDRLAALPDADVLLVEGEKAADAAQRIVGKDMAVVAWLGGTATADRINLRPLLGRRVFLWPDFDSKREKDPETGEFTGPIKLLHEQPGAKAMLTIAKALGGTASTTMLVGYEPGGKFADTWDLADAEADGWKAANVRQFIELHAGDPFSVAGAQPAADPAQDIDDEIEAAGLFQPTPAPAANDNAARPLDVDLNPYGFPHLSEKGQPQSTVENVGHLLTEYGIDAAYNVISKDVEITIPSRHFSQDNRAGNAIATITSLCSRNRVPKSELVEYITLIADGNRRNPAADYIQSRPWDGQDRFRDLVDTLDPANGDLAEILLRRWMIGAVGAAMNDGGQAMQGVLVLQGAQGGGKTSWFWSLAGNNRDLAKEGVNLNPADRDSVKSAISYWLVELGELDATFRKADIAALKSFITKDRDELFLRYSRASSSFPRRTAFIGTVNEKAYLRDETGNRRYWSIECGPNMAGIHSVDVQQVWAQALDLWRTGEQHPLTRAEMDLLNAANSAHTEISPVEELLLSKYDWSTSYRQAGMTATEALIAVGYDRPNRQQTREASMILRKLTGGEPRKSNGKQVFDLPAKIGDGGPMY